nr:MAG: nonstructural protein [Riboviria sp.]
MPEICPVKLRKFKRFVKRWCWTNLADDIFPHDEVFDFYEWINKTPYPKYRKQELTEVYERGLSRKPNKKVKAFIKDESYPDYKHVRGIYSRHDDYKCRVGPFFQKLGDIIFSKKWFIKKIPVNDRPKWIMDKFGNQHNIFCTDFSQFEATFVDKLMSVELIVYRFLLRKHPRHDEIIKTIVSGMTGKNNIQFYSWIMNVSCKRMSGEMNTSVSNGFMNLLLTHFLLRRSRK